MKRAFTEWSTPENIMLAVDGLHERNDDQTANVMAVRECVDALTKVGRAVGVTMIEEQPAAIPNSLDCKPPQDAMPAIGVLKRFADFCRTHSPKVVAIGVLPSDATDLRTGLGIVEEWLSRFAVASDDA